MLIAIKTAYGDSSSQRKLLPFPPPLLSSSSTHNYHSSLSALPDLQGMTIVYLSIHSASTRLPQQSIAAILGDKYYY